MEEQVSMNIAKSDEYKYEDIGSTRIYPQLARASLFNLHANALEIIMENLGAFQGPKNFVVIGPGAEVVPFSENLETVVSMLDHGSLVLMDYNADICAKIPAYLQHKGFGDRFTIVQVPKGEIIDPRKSSDTIYVVEHDVAEGLAVVDGSVSGVDMTLSVHHVTMYLDDITRIGADVKKVLAPGGFLHVGEGDVDMKYSERKIRSLAEEMLEMGERGVKFYDMRNCHGDCDGERNLYFGDEDYSGRFSVDNKGDVTMLFGRGRLRYTNAARMQEKYGGRIDELGEIKGQKTVLNFPLIDIGRPEDFQGMVVPVVNYYEGIGEVTLPRLEKGCMKASTRQLVRSEVMLREVLWSIILCLASLRIG